MPREAWGASRQDSSLPLLLSAQLHPLYHLPPPPQAPQSRPLGPLLLQGSQWRGRDPLVVSDLLDWPGSLELLLQKPQAPSPIPVWDRCDKGLVSIP